MEKRVLIIDDEMLMRQVIAEMFRQNGFIVEQAGDGKSGLELFHKQEYDLVILDIMMPIMDGWSVCRRIREVSTVLIIMLTSRDEDEDQLLGYELGVDEYVTKPVNIKLLLAKSIRLMERLKKADNHKMSQIIKKDTIVIDKMAYTVKVNEQMIEFAPKEYELLLFMMENDGHVLTREQILNIIWGYDYYGDNRVIDTHIKKIRHKLGKEAGLIHTVIRTGYKFDSNRKYQRSLNIAKIENKEA